MKIKKMEKWKKDLMEEQNEARKRLGLPPLILRIRECLLCKKPFESVDKRICGCKVNQITALSGVGVC